MYTAPIDWDKLILDNKIVNALLSTEAKVRRPCYLAFKEEKETLRR